MGPCCVEGCEVTSEKTFYFEFPTSRLLRRKWLDVIPIQGKLPLGTVVCSRHFNTDDYESVRGKVRLKRKVVPSLLLDEVKNLKQINSPPKSSPKAIDNCDSTTVSVPSPTEGEKVIGDDQSVIKDSKCGDNGDLRRGSTESNDICKVVHKENGWSVDTGKKDVLSPHQSLPDPKEDIEDMITNYQIKNKFPNTALLPDLTPLESETAPQQSETQETIEIDYEPEAPPVFIEISVDKGKDASANDAGSQDCLMLLESVQVEVDPTTLILDHDYDGEDDKAPDKKDDPISLLTSSDEDDVIIQEPHIDTVEVSDETDEDDMPLVKLVKKKPQKKKLVKKKARKRNKKQKENLEKIMWGMYEFYCMQCHFSTKNSVEYNNHVSKHSTVLQVCPICGFTSASKTMFARHTRKHKEEKKFKCNLCGYRARHNMSLIYHLQCHSKANFKSVKKGFKCKKCGFKSDEKNAVLKHVRLCDVGLKKFSCDKCNYLTKRKSDLKRHTLRRHKELGDDDEEYVPEA